MTLRHFLDAAYALLIEEYQRVGVPLQEAIEKLRNMGAQIGKQVDPEVELARKNAEAMIELQKLMGNT